MDLTKQYPILKHFQFSHLASSALQQVSASMCETAIQMAQALPDCDETRIGLRKLLEAKDCFVRAELSRKS